MGLGFLECSSSCSVSGWSFSRSFSGSSRVFVFFFSLSKLGSSRLYFSPLRSWLLKDVFSMLTGSQEALPQSGPKSWASCCPDGQTPQQNCLPHFVSARELVINHLEFFGKNSEIKILNKIFQVFHPNRSHWLLNSAWGTED